MLLFPILSRDCAIITWRGGWGGGRELKIREWVGIGENDKMTTRERGVGCKT